MKPEWQNVYATQPEILAYINDVVSSFDVTGYILLKQECVEAKWLNDEYLWRLKFVDRTTGHSYFRHTRILITAVGFCDIPKGTEDIHGIEKFQGHVFHSATWDHSFDFSGKDVIVVGNGCSANQFIPYLVNRTSIRNIAQVVGSSHWIAPKDDSAVPYWKKWLVCPLLNPISTVH